MKEKIKFFNLLVFMFLSYSLILSQVAHWEEYQAIEGVNEFYNSRVFGFGTLAFIPKAISRKDAESEVYFFALPRSGAYKLPRQLYYWFIVNHKSDNEPLETYLGVEIIPIYPENIIPAAEVQLWRNDGWIRLDEPTFNGERAIRKIFENISIIDFFYYHGEYIALSDIDHKFGFKWHALTKNSHINSWDKKVRWKPIVEINSRQFIRNFNSDIPDRPRMMLNGLLIRFTTTNRVRSHAPVVFGFDGRNPIAAYLKIFSPDLTEFDGEYYLTFQ